MKKSILLLSIISISISVYFALQPTEQWKETVLKKIRYESNNNAGGILTGGVVVDFTKDSSQLSTIFLLSSLLGFSYVLFKKKDS